MNITYLKEFIRLADKKNYQEAAQSLGISASSMTRHIQALEQETGTTLINRNTHSLSLTEAGQVFLRYARPIVESQNDLMQDLKSLQSDHTRNLSIGIPLNHDEGAFELFIEGFHKAHPEICVDFSAFPARKLFQYLQQEELDLVFSHEFDSDDESLTYMPFTRDELYLHITEANPLYDTPVIDYSLLEHQRIYMRYNPQSTFTRYINIVFSELGINTVFLNLEGVWPQNHSSDLFMTTGNKIHSIKHSGPVRIVPLNPPITFTYGIFYAQDRALSQEAEVFLEFSKEWSGRNHLLDPAD